MVIKVCPMCLIEDSRKEFCTVNIGSGWKGNIVHLCPDCTKKLLELKDFSYKPVKMVISNYQKSHGLWAGICGIFAHACLEYDYIMYPLRLMIYAGESKSFPTMHNPAWLPVEWLPFILMIWFIGHIVIWGINKFR